VNYSSIHTLYKGLYTRTRMSNHSGC